MKPRARPFQGVVTGLSPKGLARFKLDDHPRQGLELWGPLPGERIQVQLGQRKNVWLQEVLSVHPQRREPPCLHTGPCGGCTLQHMTEAGQLQVKADKLYGRLRELCPEAELLPPQPSPQAFHYRTKVEFSFLRDQLGYHRRGCFDRAIGVEHCWIAPPAHRPVLRHTREWMKEHALSGWDPRTESGDLRYLMVRQSNPGNDWLAVLVTRPELDAVCLEDWSRRILPYGPRGLIWVQQTAPASAIVPVGERLLWGEEYLRQSLGDLQFSLSWRSFFQTNPPAYQRMLDQLNQWLGGVAPSRLLDLYCGIGSIGLYVSRQSQLTGVENVAPAIEDARRCAAELGREAQFVCQPAEEWDRWDYDAAIVDPPRSGCHPQMVERLAESGPPELFYISCNPERLLAEIVRLRSHYRLERAVAFDFFPQTAHMELLCWFRRLPG